MYTSFSYNKYKIKRRKSVKQIVIMNTIRSAKNYFISKFLFYRCSVNPYKNNQIVPDNI